MGEMIRKSLFALLLAAGLSVRAALPAQATVREAPPAVITPDPCPHPRLLLREGEEERIRESLRTQPVLAQADSMILTGCDSILAEPVLERTLIGRRMLSTSRQALQRIFWLGYAWRVHGDDRYAERAIREMEAVCTFRNWNPDHFLDTGEMAMAVGLGYDWFYGLLSEDQRTRICQALTEKAFNPAKDDQRAWFYESGINWNSVCNAGLLYAALAVWDERPFEASFFIRRCLETNPLALAEFPREGAYPEGYSYWGYGASFQIMLLAALESAFGTDCELLDGEAGEGFLASSEYIRMMTTPTGRCWSYYDTRRVGTTQYIQAWMAVRTGDGTLLYPELRKFSRGIPSSEPRLLPMFLIYGSRLDLQGMTPPRRHFYRSGGTTPVFIYRSGWDSPDDTYLGVKAGLASSSHAHQDIGSFYLEADGVAWATDLGSQDYESLESLGVDLWNMKQAGQRWEVFRIGPWSHNILTVDGKAPSIHQAIELGRSWETKDRKGVEADLQMVYWEDLRTHVRRVWLDADDNLTVEDELECGDRPLTLRWALCSEAEAEIADSRSIRLSRNGHVRLLRAEGNGTLQAEAWPVTWQPGMDPEKTRLHAYDAPNPGMSLSGYTLKLKPHEKVTLRVRLEKIL